MVASLSAFKSSHPGPCLNIEIYQWSLMLYLITVPNVNTLTYSFESSLVTLALTLSFELITGMGCTVLKPTKVIPNNNHQHKRGRCSIRSKRKYKNDKSSLQSQGLTLNNNTEQHIGLTHRKTQTNATS